MMIDHPKKEFMRAAIEAAEQAREKGDYGIGAVLVSGFSIVARAENLTLRDHDATQHAEVAAIRQASRLKKSHHLRGSVLYTTHEPCPMCAAAVVWARLDGVVFGSTLQDMIDFRVRNGNTHFTWRTIDLTCAAIFEKSDPRPFLVEGFMRDECLKLFHDS